MTGSHQGCCPGVTFHPADSQGETPATHRTREVVAEGTDQLATTVYIMEHVSWLNATGSTPAAFNAGPLWLLRLTQLKEPVPDIASDG